MTSWCIPEAHVMNGAARRSFYGTDRFQTIHKLFLPKWGKCDWPCAPSHIYAQNANWSALFILPNEIDTIYTYNTSKEEVEPFYALDFHGDYLTKDKTRTALWKTEIWQKSLQNENISIPI